VSLGLKLDKDYGLTVDASDGHCISVSGILVLGSRDHVVALWLPGRWVVIVGVGVWVSIADRTAPKACGSIGSLVAL
jgi:hypothetical protein